MSSRLVSRVLRLFVLPLVALAPLAATPVAAAGVPMYTVTDIGTLGGDVSFAADINNAGQVVGQEFLAGDTIAHAVAWKNGVSTDLGTLGGANSFAEANNNSGVIVGNAETTDNNGDYFCGTTAVCHATMWRSGHLTDLGTIGG
jgi:probable HAF family extracellular repeat protein